MANPNGESYGRIVREARAELSRIRLDVPTPERRVGWTDMDPDEFERLLLPTRPDPARAPSYFAFWESLFDKELRFIEPRFRIVPDSLHRMATHSGHAGQGFASRWGTSRNWSGAVIAAHSGMLFRSIGATWTVPQAAKPADAAETRARPGGLPGDAWQCSVWIGLDGYRLSSLSLPQVGTVSKIDRDGNERYYLWVQWWVRDRFFGEVEVQGFDVEAHDQIQATMTVISGTEVAFLVKNVLKNTAVNVVWKAGIAVTSTAGPVELSTADKAHKGDRTLAPVEGRHAVWCVERPSVMPTDAELPTIKPHQTKQFRIPDIGGGAFQDTVALMRPPGAGSNLSIDRDLTGARYIRLIDVAGGGNPPRTRILTTPRRPNGARRQMEVEQVETANPLTPFV